MARKSGVWSGEPGVQGVLEVTPMPLYADYGGNGEHAWAANSSFRHEEKERVLEEP